MKKVWLIALKDIQIVLRDRAALLLMLAAPLVLTLGLGFVTGAFSSNQSSGLSDIPLVVINRDDGELGAALVGVLESAELADLLATERSDDEAAARQRVEDDAIAAVVVVPPGFSAGLMPDVRGALGPAAPVALYTNPARPTSSAVVQSIVTAFVSRVETAVVGTQVIVSRQVATGLIDLSAIAATAQAVGTQMAADLADGANPLITLRVDSAASQFEDFNPLAYLAPGFAMLFLMYTVTLGAQSILTERRQGTLPRLMTTPTTMTQVLGGKIAGTFLSGVMQVGVLIVGTSLMFRLEWGDPLGVLLLVVAVAAAATSWGMLIAGSARTPGQVNSAGTALMLLFGILSGTFFRFPDEGVLRWLSRITPNKWALDGFLELGTGGTLADIGPSLLALVIMTVLLFGVAALVASRSWRTAR